MSSLKRRIFLFISNYPYPDIYEARIQREFVRSTHSNLLGAIGRLIEEDKIEEFTKSGYKLYRIKEKLNTSKAQV